MYWIVRGAVMVTSRDGESVYAELNAGAFFGEIGILFDRPRTASIVACTKGMVVVLTKEALNDVLPQFPEIERAFREEAQERLSLLEKSKAAEAKKSYERRASVTETVASAAAAQMETPVIITEDTTPTILSDMPYTGVVIRELLKEIELFATLPSDILHDLALTVEPTRHSPFEYILRQDSPGREIFFVVSGIVEVIDERTQQIKARLGKGAHFGEVTFLSLAPTRTASVRSVTMAECLVLTSAALRTVMEQYPKIQQSIERTARERMVAGGIGEYTVAGTSMSPTQEEIAEVEKPADPDPLSLPLSRTASTFEMPILAGGSKTTSSTLSTEGIGRLNLSTSPSSLSSGTSLSRSESNSSQSSSRSPSPAKEEGGGGSAPRRHSRRQASLSAEHGLFTRHKRARRGAGHGGEILPDAILVNVFSRLGLQDQVRLLRVNKHWRELLLGMPEVLQVLDLSPYNTRMYDATMKSIAAFAGSRPEIVDISNCFHLSDEGFAHLVSSIGKGIRVFRMRSAWEVSGMAIMELTAPGIAKTLEEIDLSNCRKVGDATLARMVGWVVPESASVVPGAPPAGTVVGCPKLKRISLGYCKHITDKSIHHLAVHASARLEWLNLTRCTTVTDAGFGYWAQREFPRLTRLCLADCTFLTDKAIIALASACKSLQELDVSFCCALSDVSVEVLALGCAQLRALNLAFCGSAVSDASLRAVALHLQELRQLSVRGCVRVTAAGVDAVGAGCEKLELLDISQCKNVTMPLRGMSFAWTATGAPGWGVTMSEKSADNLGMQVGGSGRVRTYGSGTGLWRGARVRVVF
ncbi:uncharacterized protein V1518DRAFT_416577 [Limtongia smithiae]|uniref:uncharacterized protein n=1 Tax=Limtongia smithiae TaxID=1125753 RepID=UPI0034CF86B6